MQFTHNFCKPHDVNRLSCKYQDASKGRQPFYGDWTMNTLMKTYAVLIGLCNLIMAALLVAAVTGWTNPAANSLVGGHYNLQPIW
jgi:hypothetical protein